jgi:hypothetical protein
MSMYLQSEVVRGTNKAKVKVKLRSAHANTEGRRRYSTKSFTKYSLDSNAPRETDPRTDQVLVSHY